MADERNDTPPSHSPDFAATASLKRRDFLRAGAMASVGLAVLAPQTGCASDNGPRFSAEPDDVGANESTDVCPGTVDSILPNPDQESAEVAMGVLWGFFVRGAVQQTDQIDFTAIQAGVGHSRGYVLQEIQNGGGLGNFPWRSYGANWGKVGAEAGALAGSGGIINASIFDAAWLKVYGTTRPAKAFRFPDPVAEATETIGSDLWVRFALGIASFDKTKDYELPIVITGRAHSRYYIRNQVIRQGVVAGIGRPDYSKWDFGPVDDCGHKTGRRAAKEAGTNPITVDDFHLAWCEIGKFMRAWAERTGQDWHTMSSGCS